MNNISWIDDRFVKKTKNYKESENIDESRLDGIFRRFSRTNSKIFNSIKKADNILSKFNNLVHEIPKNIINIVYYHSNLIKKLKIAVIILIIWLTLLSISYIYLLIRVATTIGLY